MGNLGTNYLILGIALATILGVYAITTSGPTTFSMQSAHDTMPYLMGHVTMEVRGSDGNIKYYYQTDNIVTNQGLECALDVLFNITAGACTSTGDFSVIALSNNASIPSNTDDRFDVQTEWVSNNQEVARTAGANTITRDGIKVTIAEVFVEGDNSGLAINDVVARTGLFDSFNSGQAANMIASASLASTTITDNDSVTVTWTITGTSQ